jgi:hypothetical protein
MRTTMRASSAWRIACAAALLGLLAAGCGQAPFFKAGDPIGKSKAVSLAELAANPRAYAGERVLVEGVVTGVCKGSGCWALVEESPGGASVYAKSPDHSVGVPTDCEGARIRVAGEVVVVEPSGDTAAHAEPGEHGEGTAPHECPQPECYVKLSAVELFKK